jgi:son of sevenless
MFITQAKETVLPESKHDMVDYMAKVVKDKNEKGTYTSFFEIIVDKDSCPPSIVPKSWASVTFMDLDELEIARQLTIEEYHLYAEIKPEELQDLAWSKPKLKHRAPNVLQITERFNHISNACAALVISEERHKNRTKLLEKLIRIMDHLYSMNSFNMQMAIMSAFGQSSVHRLKWSFSGIKPKYGELAQKFQTLFSSEGSSKNLRQALEAIQPPAIPFL